jgi:hypothetical protein
MTEPEWLDPKQDSQRWLMPPNPSQAGIHPSFCNMSCGLLVGVARTSAYNDPLTPLVAQQFRVCGNKEGR